MVPCWKPWPQKQNWSLLQINDAQKTGKGRLDVFCLPQIRHDGVAHEVWLENILRHIYVRLF